MPLTRSGPALTWRVLLVISLIPLLLASHLDAATAATTADTTTPTLKSFSVSGAQATPGSTVTINYLADDDSGALRNVIFQFT
ncbi:hypothetical protein ACFU8W_31365, partial [Streptomyces sp. NPDC057565]|uniref:hypothetical protein n=1 Tax=Streptomyces sp. NPDC057565 TaxID=3346169 RepID=UPI0036BD40D2